METLLNVSLPFFGLIAAGYAAGHTRILSAAAAEGLNVFVFWFTLPPFLFMKMFAAAPEAILDPRFVLAYSGGGLLCCAICVTLGRVLFHPPFAQSVIQGMAAGSGNIGYMGLPIIVAVFGERMLLPAVSVILLDSIVMLCLPAALIQFDRSRSNPGAAAQGAGIVLALRSVSGALLRNPLIIASAAGLGWGALGIPLPVPIATFGNLLANAAAPCALFVLGATLVGRPLTSGIPEIALMSGCKLLLHPALVLGLANAVALDPQLTAVAVVEASLPIAANVFTVARAYDVYAERASSAILFSTICAVVTVSGFLLYFSP